MKVQQCMPIGALAVFHVPNPVSPTPRLSVKSPCACTGASVYIEVRHWKGSEGRMSLLAWSHAPVEALADLGAEPPSARCGSLFLHLWRKPLEPGAPRAPARLRALNPAHEHDLFLTVGAAE